ncbi:MAG: serine--tRNA ligase [Patescibacteria group bacterium]
MLDIKFIRENQGLIKEAARKKRVEFDVQELINADDKRLKLLKEVEEMRAEQNAQNDSIVKIKDEKEKNEAIEKMKKLKDQLTIRENELKITEKEWSELMFLVPNIPDPSVPEGESEADNQEIRKRGEIPQFDFSPKSHIELMENLNLIDLERGIKVAGFRGYFLKGDAARLSMALWNFAMDKMIQKNFEPFIAPSLVKSENLFATGHFPKSKEDVYKTQDELYLTGTAEIPMTGYFRDEILREEDLPKTYVAFSPCYRREAGSHGKDTKGIYRLHEFAKVEQFILCEADHQESVKWHEELTRNAEEILQDLGIPYRVVVNCTGDTGQANVKTYDIESWIPSEKKYRESHSSSYYHDFQARRANIKYRTKDGKLLFAHTLNNTAIATPRILISILENYQQKDGSVIVPEVLRKYLNKDIIS